jgi:hypothetical protein
MVLLLAGFAAVTSGVISFLTCADDFWVLDQL